MLTGWKTLIVGLLLTIGPGALHYLAAVDWTQFGVSPTIAFAISGVIMIVMRYFTNTPITKPDAVASVAAMPDVIRVVTAATVEGRKLADSVPGNSVVTVTDPTARLHA